MVWGHINRKTQKAIQNQQIELGRKGSQIQLCWQQEDALKMDMLLLEAGAVIMMDEDKKWSLTTSVLLFSLPRTTISRLKGIQGSEVPDE